MKHIIALVILHALVSNPERYKDMKALDKDGIPSRDITQKNINKAYYMASQFIETIKTRKVMGLK